MLSSFFMNSIQNPAFKRQEENRSPAFLMYVFFTLVFMTYMGTYPRLDCDVAVPFPFISVFCLCFPGGKTCVEKGLEKILRLIPERRRQ
jgi:hypothetical protein